jgi:hypothetical protein
VNLDIGARLGWRGPRRLGLGVRRQAGVGHQRRVFAAGSAAIPTTEAGTIKASAAIHERLILANAIHPTVSVAAHTDQRPSPVVV